MQFVPVIGSRELEVKAGKKLAWVVTSEIYLLERMLRVGAAVAYSYRPHRVATIELTATGPIELPG